MDKRNNNMLEKVLTPSVKQRLKEQVNARRIRNRPPRRVVKNGTTYIVRRKGATMTRKD